MMASLTRPASEFQVTRSPMLNFATIMDCLQLVQQRRSSFTDNLRSKTIFVHDDIALNRNIEARHAQHSAALTHIPMPSLGYTRLDGTSHVNRRRQHLIAVVLPLGTR